MGDESVAKTWTGSDGSFRLVFETGHERLDRVHARLSLAGTPHEGEELDVPAGPTEANVTLAPR